MPAGFWKSLNLKLFYVNDRNGLVPNICCLCSEHYPPCIIANSNQFIAFSIMKDGQEVFVSFVYVASNVVVRRQLWSSLSNLQLLHQGPWCSLKKVG